MHVDTWSGVWAGLWIWDNTKLLFGRVDHDLQECLAVSGALPGLLWWLDIGAVAS